MPLISGRVTRMRCEMSWLSMAFQSILPVFQSFCSCSPKIIRSASTSAGEVTTRMMSFCWSVLSEVGIETLPSRQMREMTKRWWLWAATSWTLLPKMAGLVTW